MKIRIYLNTAFIFVLVKVFLLIPMIALLLANVPVVLEVKMPSTEDEQCFLTEEKDEETCGMMKKMKCCKTSETTCQAVTCFHVLAPLHPLSKFGFEQYSDHPTFNLYKPAFWQDPVLDGLLQPPDFAL